MLGLNIRWMERDFTLKDKETKKPVYQLQKGTWAHMPQELHQFDEKYFESPDEFRAERHIKETVGEDGVKTKTVDLGTIKPFGTLRPVISPFLSYLMPFIVDSTRLLTPNVTRRRIRYL